MSTRHTQARERFDRLTKQTADGPAFFAYGARGAGYRLGERAARRIKLYFAYQFWIFMGLFMAAWAVLEPLGHAHPFIVSVAVGAILWALDRLVMVGLLLGSRRGSARLQEEEVADKAAPPSRIETSCELANIAIFASLCIVFAVVTRNIDAWFYAIACAAFFVYSLIEARKARRRLTPADSRATGRSRRAGPVLFESGRYPPP